MYSASCGSGTAQSSTKEIGFPSLLHRHHDVEAGGAQIGDRGLQGGIEHVDHAAPLRAARGPSRSRDRPSARGARLQPPRVLGRRSRRTRRAAAPPARRARTASSVGRNIAISRASAIIVASTSSTAIGFELDDVLGRLHRLVERAEMADAERALAEHGPELELDRGGIGERAFRADENMREIVSRPHSARARRYCSRRRAAAPWESAPRPRRPRARRCARARARAASARDARRHVGEIGGHRAEMRRSPSASTASIETHIVAHRAVAQRAAAAGVVARHAADRGARGGRDVDREPEPMRLSARLSSSSTMPGSTTQRRAATSSERMRLRYFEPSMTRPRLIVWPHCEVPPPRGVHRHALLARDRERAHAPRPSCAAPPRRAASSGNARRRSRNGRA